MFWRKRVTDERPADEPDLRCSFCNKDQHDVRKLIAGPAVFICDDCVQLCSDIIADDTIGPAVAEQLARAADEIPNWSPAVTCTLCRMPVVLEEALRVEGRALLCAPCVSAIQNAAAQPDSSSAPPDA